PPRLELVGPGAALAAPEVEGGKALLAPPAQERQVEEVVDAARPLALGQSVVAGVKRHQDAPREQVQDPGDGLAAQGDEEEIGLARIGFEELSQEPLR